PHFVCSVRLVASLLLFSLCLVFSLLRFSFFLLFFFNSPATTEIYTLSLHDALPIFDSKRDPNLVGLFPGSRSREVARNFPVLLRSEEHTSELQSHLNLVCRLLLEKKKKHIKQLFY